MQDTFLPTDYEAPVVESNYMKFQEGLNSFRILSSAITGYEYFNTSNKPVRSKKAPEVVPSDIKEKGRVKHFWAFVVWNYQEKKIQILEITQVTIMNAISSLISNPKWGNPKNYDIAVTKTGEGLETEYSVQGEPPISEPEQEIVDAYIPVKIELEKLFVNEDPFGK